MPLDENFEDGIHTEICYSRKELSNKEGRNSGIPRSAVIERLGQKPYKMIPVEYDKEDTKTNGDQTQALR